MPGLAFQPNGYSFTLFGVATIASLLCLYSWRRRAAPVARIMMLFMASIAIWSFGYAMELASQEVPMMLVWFGIEMVGIVTAPVLWLLFALRYTGRDPWFAPQKIVLLFVIPALTLVIFYTNSWHHLYFGETSLDNSGPFPTLEIELGPWYDFYIVYAFITTLIVISLFLRHSLGLSRVYRSQIWALIIASVMPLIGHALYLLGWTPLRNLDLAPFAFLITALSTIVAMSRFRLLDATPIARDTLFENLHDGIIVLDAQANIIDLNLAARRYLLLDEDVVGQSVQTANSGWLMLPRFATSQRKVRTEIVMGQARLRHLEVDNSPLYDNQGHYAGSYLTIRNINPRKEAEAALRARQVAEAANQAKGLFLAMMSHEIRTPMNGVLGTINLLLESELTPLQHELGTAARQSAEELLNLLNDILDFSKIEAGKLDLVVEDFDLQVLLDSLQHLFVEHAGRKSLHYSQQIGPNIPTLLRGDVGRLRQVLVNLTSNAIKFTQQGEIAVQVRLEAEQPNTGIALYFAVSDTGIGISSEKIPRLFNVFSQVDSTTQRKYGGSGLGLVISRQLVELMGGRIGVESVQGRGSTFWFTVLLQEQTLEAPKDEQARYLNVTQQPALEKEGITQPHPIPAPAAGSVLAEEYTPQNRRVLVVEDNITNQKVVLAVLKKLGYQADVAHNGLEAVQAFSQHSYNMILMDVAMPEMDGLEATRRIRNLERLESGDPHIPIIAMTAHAMSDDRARCLAAGMDDYITKPIRLPDFVALVSQWSGSPIQTE